MFDSDYVNGVFDAILKYFESAGVKYYEVKREGWQVSFKQIISDTSP